MGRKIEKAQKHKPTEEWGWSNTSSLVFFLLGGGGGLLSEAAGLLAADGLLRTCNVWENRRESHICCLVSYFFGPLELTAARV